MIEKDNRIERIDLHELIYMLGYQYPAGISTFGYCPLCGGSSRGAGFCKECITEEIMKRGYSSSKVNKINELYLARAKISHELDEVVSSLGE